jgi:hypothetical protein
MVTDGQSLQSLSGLKSLSGDEDTRLALDTLRTVSEDSEAPAAARAQAARTMLEIKGLIGRHAAAPADTTASLSTMSRADLEAELARLRPDPAASATVAPVKAKRSKGRAQP